MVIERGATPFIVHRRSPNGGLVFVKNAAKRPVVQSSGGGE